MLIRVLLIAALLLALPVLASANGGKIYRWVDADGKVHFSDCPPASESVAEEVTKKPLPTDEEAARARRKLDRLIQEQEASYDARKQEKKDREIKRIEAQEQAVALKRQCARARQNLHTFSKPRPVYTIDDKGDYIFLTDEERKAKIEQSKQFIAENCEGG